MHVRRVSILVLLLAGQVAQAVALLQMLNQTATALKNQSYVSLTCLPSKASSSEVQRIVVLHWLVKSTSTKKNKTRVEKKKDTEGERERKKKLNSYQTEKGVKCVIRRHWSMCSICRARLRDRSLGNNGRTRCGFSPIRLLFLFRLSSWHRVNGHR